MSGLEEILEAKYGYKQFRPGQKVIIEDLLAGRNVIGMMPTGGGKSLCYQLPGYLLDGSVVIVSPLLSLMEDQVAQLRQIGEKRVIAFNSFRTSLEKREAMGRLETYKFIFVSPEMLQYDVFFQALRRIKIALFVVDEAHCISQWGHEFRTDYMKIKECLQELQIPSVLALTATATEEVLADMKDSLGLCNVNYHLQSIDRPNIAIVVEEVRNSAAKVERVISLVQQLQGPGIIYCSSRALTEQLAHQLKQSGVEDVEAYHGGMEQEKRMLIQQQFMKDQLSIISSTSAFGMGVNKANVRFVIHLNYPSNMESYLQEIGRAGRDGEDSIAILLTTPGDEELPLMIISEELPSKEQLEQLFYLLRQEGNLDNDTSGRIQQIVGLDEVKWRFMGYHLHKLGIVTDQQIHRAMITEQALRTLYEIIEQRTRYKLKKLYNMKHWLQDEGCRRQSYLHLFGETLQQKGSNCCDRCGVDLTKYEKIMSDKVKTSFYWKEELAIILGLKEREEQ